MSEQPHPDRVRLLPWALPPWAVDGGFVALMVLGAVVRRVVDDGADHPSELVALVVAVGVILSRRRFPVPSLVVGVVATPVLVGLADQPSVIMLAALVALFHLATERSTRTAVVAGLVTTLVFASVVITLLAEEVIDGAGLAAIAWPAFATAVGTAIRGGRENLAAANERARRAEENRELEAGRRVIEERLRIARDVHDLVAHHLAVINVQSGVAGHVLRTDPDTAEAAVGNVREVASTAIDELGQLLGVLRSPAEVDGGAGGPVDPTADLDAVDDLIASFSASGLELEHRTTGAPRPLSPSAQVAAYRIVQEALTNAHKHGDGAAVLTQRYGDEALEVVVTNRPGNPTDEPAGSGYGLVGMRERVEAVGGQLSVDATADRFSVRATIPARSPR